MNTFFHHPFENYGVKNLNSVITYSLLKWYIGTHTGHIIEIGTEQTDRQTVNGHSHYAHAVHAYGCGVNHSPEGSLWRVLRYAIVKYWASVWNEKVNGRWMTKLGKW